MQFEVLKEFTFNGRNLVRGDTLEIPDESTKIGALTRSKFIRYAPEGVKKELPKVEQVAKEIEAEREPVLAGVARSPKEIVREAKAKATSKR